jgi:basic amino acid/polyamine antiporter, APA family
MTEQARDKGLVRVVGTWGLAAGTINIIIGAGIFAVPGELASSMGVYAPLAFAVCAAAIIPIAICFAEGGSRMPTSGGAYGYIEATLGPLAGFIVATLQWAGDVLAAGGVSAALGETAASVVAPSWHTPVRVAVTLGSIGAIAWVNLGGVARGARFVNVATLIKLVPLAAFLVLGLGGVHAENFQATTSLHNEDLGRGLLLALYTFTGMEVSTTASGEVADPARTIPRALAISILTVSVVFIGVQIVAQGLMGPALAESTAPLADAAARISPALRVLMLFGAAFSMLAWLGTDLLGSPRVLFALARDGRMPRVLGRVNARTHVPHVAIIVYAAIAMILALSGTFAELAVLATLTTTVVYLLACTAAWLLARRNVALAGAPLNFPFLGIAAFAGIATMVIAIGLAAREEIIGLAALLSLSAVVFWLTERWQRRRAAA